MDNFESFENYYPKDIYQTEKKKNENPSPNNLMMDSLVKTLTKDNPLASALLSNGNLNQSALSQLLKSGTKKPVKSQTLDENAYEEY